LIGAGSAVAETSTIGELALTPNGGLADTTGQNIPVFQGAASANYVLSSPRSGTITSWSFLSGGIETGKQFVLRVLAPAGAAGTDWQAVSTSSPVAVTSTTGADEVNGPFAANLPIAAGDRIALQPIDGESTPIESGVIGQDGIRFFMNPFPDGSTATQAGEEDNGQVVPIQATLTYAVPQTEPPLTNPPAKNPRFPRSPASRPRSSPRVPRP